MRLQWLDACKGFGIALVVAGHIYKEPGQVWGLGPAIFLFHMPFFFIISGITFKPSGNMDFVVKRWASLLVPYAAFMGLLIVMNSFVAFIGSSAATPHPSLKAAIWSGTQLTGDYGVFWFPTCLFLALVLLNGIVQVFGGMTRPLTTMCIAFFAGVSIYVGLHPQLSGLPWSVANVPLAVAFLWIGFVCGKLRPVTLLILAIPSGVFSTVLAFMTGHLSFDMKYVDYGTPALGSIIAMSLSGLIVAISRLYEGRWMHPFAVLGRYSLPIMFLHQFIHFKLLALGTMPVFVVFALSLGLSFAIGVVIESAPALSTLFLGRGLGAKLLSYRVKEEKA